MCILLPILIGLICALLGYLLGRMCKRPAATGNTELNAKIASLTADLEACRSKSVSFQAEIDKLKAEVASPKMNMAAPEIEFNADAAAAAFGKKILKDDLKIVEGIGPKIEELFHAAGIKTWKALSELPVEACKKILDDGGDRFQMHDPGTWPKQCLLAYEGKWQELKDWQDKLDAGKE